MDKQLQFCHVYKFHGESVQQYNWMNIDRRNSSLTHLMVNI